MPELSERERIFINDERMGWSVKRL